ncbi:peptidylprolyl isomerase [Clostridium sp. YIM B02551]|uniref:peptidylprolyl isomerase n=1 Tax=Clostridium sp. YIM B02551 TaxID=2910679 RepID=UPI001EEAFBC5|nr:peptidylprolyl isomerase [Clostridium sp. YIM B02551]
MENKVLAIVAGNEITEKDLNEAISKYPADRRGMLASEEGKKQLLEQVISFELMYNFGKENSLDNTKEFEQEVEKFKKELLTQMVINKVVSEVTVTDDDALKFYNENKEMFLEPDTVTAKHILVPSEEECNAIKDEIEAGSITFEEAAAKYSTCPSKEQGGNLGSFSRGMMVPEFEESAFNAEIGKVTESVKTQFGYHLIKVESKNPAKELGFEEVKDGVINQLIQQNQQKKYFDLVDELSKKYGVERK